MTWCSYQFECLHKPAIWTMSTQITSIHNCNMCHLPWQLEGTCIQCQHSCYHNHVTMKVNSF